MLDKKIKAFFIDYLFICVCIFVLSTDHYFSYYLNYSIIEFIMRLFLVLIVSSMFYSIYSLVLEFVFNKTIGEKLLKIENKKRVKKLKIIEKNIFKLLTLVPCFIGIITIIFKGNTLWNIISDMNSIRKKIIIFIILLFINIIFIIGFLILYFLFGPSSGTWIF